MLCDKLDAVDRYAAKSSCLTVNIVIARMDSSRQRLSRSTRCFRYLACDA